MNPIVEINHQALSRAFDFLKSLNREQPRDVLLLSPYVEDFALVRRHLAQARIFVATVKTWNLNAPFSGSGKVDLVVSSNVFHYSPDPDLWFQNVFSMTRLLLVQDLISRRRSSASNGLCSDGDCVRYMYRDRGVISDFEAAHDLSPLRAQMLYFDDFDGGRNEYHVAPAAAPRHYCAIIESPNGAPGPSLGWRDFLRFRLPSIGLAVRGTVFRALTGVAPQQ